MKRIIYLLIIGGMLIMQIQTEGQNKDKAVFREAKPGFIQNCVLKDDPIESRKNETAEMIKEFQLDLTEVVSPNKLDQYKNQQWRKPPESQWNT